MQSLRYWLKVFAAFIKRFRKLLALSGFVGVLIFIFLPQAKAYLSFFETEKIGYVGRFSAEDLPIIIQKEISYGLTHLDENNNVMPSIAESWESQEEGKVWIFRLNGEYKWQDKSTIKAQDINYKFSDVTSEVIDDKTIKFILKDPFSPFPNVVSRPVFKRGLLGSGDWKVDKFSFQNTGRSTGFVRLTNSKTGKTKIYKFYPTEEDARLALKLGEVNKLLDLIDSKDLKNWKNLNIFSNSRNDLYVGVFINNQDKVLSDKTIRQALAYAINKDNFEGLRSISPISPKSWAFNPQVKQYSYNTERAKELLKGVNKELLAEAIRIVTIPTLLPIADKIKSDWEAVGMKVQVQVSTTPPADFQTLLAIQEIPPDPDQYVFWHSTQTASNITNYRSEGSSCCKESPRIDKLLEEGRRTIDQEVRKEIYFDFQRFLVEDSPVIFLYHPITYNIERK